MITKQRVSRVIISRTVDGKKYSRVLQRSSALKKITDVLEEFGVTDYKIERVTEILEIEVPYKD